MEKLYIVMPAYNEEKNIEAVVRSWHAVIEKIDKTAKLLIVDDGSKDDTYNIIWDLQRELPQIEFQYKENSGHGATVLFAYEYAIARGATYIFQTDSDGQTNPEEFLEFWKQREKYDMIIGNRVKRGDGFFRKFASKILKFVIKITLHTNVEDANTPFRLMKVETLKKYLPKVPKDFYLSNALLTTLFIKFEEKVKFIPITFRARKAGKNSINFEKLVHIGWNTLRDFRKINKTLEMQK